MTKTISLLLVLVFVTVSAASQSKRISSAKPDSRTCNGTIVESEVHSTSRVSGLVVDTANMFMPRVLLEMRSTEGNKVFRLKNGADGNFRFPSLPEGRYVLKARWLKKGFDCAEIPVSVTGSLEQPMTIVLSPSPVHEKTELR
jgi:hypothetical protein